MPGTQVKKKILDKLITHKPLKTKKNVDTPTQTHDQSFKRSAICAGELASNV